MSLCPCHSKKPYNQCCRPYHQEIALPPNALALMRSRYSAYALGLVKYIIETTDPKGPMYRPERKQWEYEIALFGKNSAFTGLSILSFEEEETRATVTFIAYIQQGQNSCPFKEKSLFNKVKGRWLYHSGETEAAN